MRRLYCLVLSVLLAAIPLGVCAADADPTTTLIRNLFPNTGLSPWVYVQGDLTGDGIADLSVILTGESATALRDEKLLVLQGKADGGFAVLAMSDTFCLANKFYNLEIEGKALRVTGISSTTPVGYFTLLFRYNPRRKDVELIQEGFGHAPLTEGDAGFEADPTGEDFTADYLHHRALHTYNKAGEIYKKETAKINLAPLTGLQGFNCGDHGDALWTQPFMKKLFRTHP